jgi:Cu/Ag efflux protein CusF
VALALGASAASAAQWTGTVEQINEVQRTIVVNDEMRPDQQHVFTVSDMNTVGATIHDLQEGDQVNIFYAASGAREGQPTNAMRITKVGEATDAAQMGETAEWRGAVEEVDPTARTVMVDGQQFVVDDTVALDELQPGDQVVVVYDHTGDEPEVVEITRIQ